MTWRRSSSSVDTLTLDEVKSYLRINYPQDDSLILQLIGASLDWVNNQKQRPTLPTDYVDSYGELDSFPALLKVEDTEIPIALQVFYFNPSGVEVELAASAFEFDYFPDYRLIEIKTENPPDIQENSLIRVVWSSNAISPDAAIAARKLMIANWYENREATVGGSNSELQFGVTALVSPDSLVI